MKGETVRGTSLPDESSSSQRLRGASAVRVQAPAKINLLLRVLAREASGYHGIESLFARLELHDVVTVHTATSGASLTVQGPQLPDGGLGPDHENLAWRAAVAFQAAVGWPGGFAIDIAKHIPVGGGLGGGSADAAAVLRGLNALAPTPLSAAELVTLAGSLGADVPFLASDALLAWSWSRGDRLLALPPLPSRPVELLAFREGVHTGFAYAAVANHRAGAAPAGSTASGAAAYALSSFASWPSVAALAHNDFEAVVPGLHAGVAGHLPALRALAGRLSTAAEPAIGLMSGSGATCLLIHPDAVATEASEGLSALTGEGVTRIRTRTAAAIVEPAPIL